jgi:hypothetical protein
MELPFLMREGARGVVWCSDRRRNVHAWNDDVGYKCVRKQQVKQKGNESVDWLLRALYPNA